MGVAKRDDPHVVAGLQVALDDLASLIGGCRAPVFQLHSDKAKEFLAKSARSLPEADGIRQTTSSGRDSCGLMALLRDGLVLSRSGLLHSLLAYTVTHADGWHTYNHRVLSIRLNSSYPLFRRGCGASIFENNLWALKIVGSPESLWERSQKACSV